MDVFEFDLSDGSVSTLYDNAFPAQWYGGMEKDPNSNLMYVSSWDDGLIRSFNPLYRSRNRSCFHSSCTDNECRRLILWQ